MHDAPGQVPASTRPVCSRRASSASSHYRRISGFAGVNPGASDVKNDDLIEGRRFPAACCRELQYGEVLMIFGPAHHTGMRTSHRVRGRGTNQALDEMSLMSRTVHLMHNRNGPRDVILVILHRIAASRDVREGA